MKGPIGWYGDRLIFIGSDGRQYISRKAPGWLMRWLYRNLPKYEIYSPSEASQ